MTYHGGGTRCHGNKILGVINFASEGSLPKGINVSVETGRINGS